MAAEVGTDKSTISAWERRPGIEIGAGSRSRDKARRWLAILAVLDATAAAGRGVTGRRGVCGGSGYLPFFLSSSSSASGGSASGIPAFGHPFWWLPAQLQ